jgi:hypothetical protein
MDEAVQKFVELRCSVAPFGTMSGSENRSTARLGGSLYSHSIFSGSPHVPRLQIMRNNHKALLTLTAVVLLHTLTAAQQL